MILLLLRESSFIFASDDFHHILGTLLAAILKPHAYDPRNTRPEELRMVSDELIIKILRSSIGIVSKVFQLCIISKLEICAVEALVILYMAEQLQIIVAAFPVLNLIPVHFRHVVLKFPAYRICDIMQPIIAGIEGGPVDSGFLAEMGYRYPIKFLILYQFHECLLYRLESLSPSPVVCGIHFSFISTPAYLIAVESSPSRKV